MVVALKERGDYRRLAVSWWAKQENTNSVLSQVREICTNIGTEAALNLSRIRSVSHSTAIHLPRRERYTNGTWTSFGVRLGTEIFG